MTSSTGTVVFNDAKLQAIDVVATERLGVGTLDPASNLHVVGNVHVTGNVNKLNFTDGYTIKRGANVTVFGTTDVIQEITGPHARHVVPLRKYPEVLLTSNVQGGYVASASNASDTRPPWHAFDGDVVTAWGTNGGAFSTGTPGSVASSGSYPGEIITLADGTSHDRGHWLKLNLPNKIKIYNYKLRSGSTDRRPASISLLGSNDDTNWYIIKDVHSVGATDEYTVSVNSPSAYGYIMLLVHSIVGSDNQMKIDNLEYYGYEETSDPDTSVDTKITSQFNLPDTTGVKLYIDGDKGSTPTDFSGEGHTLTENNATYDSAEKAWEFTSLSTSNVTMSTGDFAMEGTHPHAVSMWFNAANVSSNATLFHVGTAAGEGDAKTAISLTETGHLGWIDGGDNQFLSANTWHNLVYATQGGGGVRTCYLDGRKLGDVSVQDTFGDYPPFAMSTYSEYGYTVSANHTRSGYHPYDAFDDETDDDDSTLSRWWSSADVFSGNVYNGSTSDHCGTFQGAYLKLELPYKLICSHVNLWLRDYNDGSTPNPQSPKNFKIVGSNDDINWVELKDEVNFVDTGNVSHPVIVNATKGYKYLAIVVTRVNNSTLVSIMDVEYYGHKENDTTRFPVSSTVLKYPHVAMTGQPGTSQSVSDLQHAQRGYEVTASSMYVDNASNPYQPWRVFDGDTASSWFSRGLSSLYGGTDNAYGSVANANLGTDSGGSATHRGEWLKLKLPRKLVLNRIVMYTSGSEAPEDFTLYGSNDGSSWTEILAETGLAATSNGATYTPSSTPSAYKYFGLVITRTVSRHNYTGIRELELYGTEEDLDVVARVGEGLDGKVANFRVYDKYLHEEQALELWDAQKDQFGRAESSVVVHKGRLGVGTTEPEGRFAVLDEAGEMGEFPPKPMTDYETYMEGHGVFKASADRERNTYESWRAFDKSVDFFDNILDLNGNNADQYEESSGDYIGSATTTTLDAGQIDGSWIQLQIPYKVKLSSFALAPQPKGAIAHFYGASRMPKTGSIVGSNDGVNWYLIGSITKDEYGAGLAHFSMNSTSFYSYFRLIAQTITAGDFSIYRNRLALSQFNLFGTREQGQSTLHDGQLTLTKNLTVPRIGPALDADDTPRRDRLVVEYNTSTNPTANGTVKDTSGRGLDGLLYGASYDATEKALVFDGTDDYIKVDDTGIRGDYIHSVSFWIYNDNYNINPFWIGENLDGKRINVYITASQIDYSFRGDTVTTTLVPPINRWWHLTLTYNGTQGINGRKIYIDGVEQTTTHSGTAAALNIVDGVMYLGTNFQQASDLNGKMSSLKFYDVALTTDEVKRLYDMGRSDEGHHVVNFSKTRVGIGLGDGEAPQAALEVRDQGILSKGYIGGPYNGGTGRTSDLVIKQSGDVNDSAKTSGVRMFRAANDTNSWHFGVNTGTNLEFLYNNASMAYMGRVNVSALDFTGQHRSFVDGVPHTEYDNLEGLIVSANKNKYYDINEDITRGAHAIQISQSLPLVSLSTEEKDKACFGVISGSEDPESREYSQGSFVSVVQKQKGDRRAFINSVGEGAMWVVNTVGDLESGDYITTSNVAGYGQKQESDSLKNYTVAKITMDCDFNPQDQPIQRIKQSNVVETHYTGLVPVVKGVPHEFVTTTVTADDEWSNVSVSPSDVTYAEWSNLEAKVQNTYTLTYTQTSNVVYDVKYTKTTTANVTAEDAWDAVHIEPPSVTYAEYSNLEANVQNTYSLTYTMTTKVEATEAIYSNLSTEDKTLFIPTYYQMVEQTVDAEYPGAVKHETVTDRLENALDEHGQLQWEDEPSGATEKAYKIRYLDASGQQTDEANCVHRAAFVGCTYHCG